MAFIIHNENRYDHLCCVVSAWWDRLAWTTNYCILGIDQKRLQGDREFAGVRFAQSR